jgi:hypothetical protein
MSKIGMGCEACCCARRSCLSGGEDGVGGGTCKIFGCVQQATEEPEDWQAWNRKRPYKNKLKYILGYINFLLLQRSEPEGAHLLLQRRSLEMKVFLLKEENLHIGLPKHDIFSW